MTEVAHAGKHHRHTVLVGGGNYFGVAHRATWLDDRGNACSSGGVDPVAEREEGIRCHD